MNEAEGYQRFREALKDRYAVEGEIGRGGMAVVYRAQDLKHDRPVAIKVLEPQFGVTLGAERFLQEIAIESRLQHPNILALFDSGQVHEFLYFVTPLADGGSLRDRLSKEGPLAVEDALAITREVGDALAYAHRQGVVHRDIKPGNILFSAGRPLVADFGLAQAVSDVGAERLTRTGVSVGTPAYMSPEQASGQQAVDHRSDIYSLGCVLFEMLAGDPPFSGPNPRIVLARQVSERPPSVEVARPQVPPQVADALKTALAKAPADRYRSVEKFLEALEGSGTGHQQHTKRAWLGRITAVAVLAVLALLAGKWLMRPVHRDLSPDKVAVFPFSTRGVGAPTTMDGIGIAYLVGAALEHADPLRFIDVTGRLTERQLGDPGVVSLDEARSIAANLGAGFFLTGVVQGHRDSTTVIIRAYDVAADSLVDQWSETGENGTVPLHRLGIDGVLGLLPALIDPGTPVDLTALRDRDPDAVALWWQGEREYRQSNFAASLDLYERALAEDSALAIAAVKGAQSADWIHEIQRGHEMVRLALSRESFLPQRYALLARGLEAFFDGDAEASVHLLQQAVELYPDWWEARTALGESYYHLLPAEANLDSLAEDAFEQSLRSGDPTPPLFHLVEIRARRGDLAGGLELLDRYRAADPEPALVHQLSMMMECVAEPRTMGWVQRALLSPSEVLAAGKSLSVAGRQMDCAEGAYRGVLGSETATPADRWGAFMGLQAVLVATGRDREGQLLIDSVTVKTGIARSLYVLDALAGARMDERAAELEQYARDRYGTDYGGVVNLESLWVLSLWLHHTQEIEPLERIGETAARRLADPDLSDPDRLFAEAIAVRASLSQDTAAAIERLRDITSRTSYNLSWGFGSALPPDRLLLARLLMETGRFREAWDAASVFDHPQPIMFVPYVPESLAIRYRAALALADERSAEGFHQRLQRMHRLELVGDSS